MIKNYKVVCEQLDLVLLVKSFTLEEEKSLYESIRKKLSNAKSPISIDSYKGFILKHFLCDYEELKSNLPKDQDERKEIIDAVYDSVVLLYLPFRLEIICTDLNNQTFLGGASTVLAALNKSMAEGLFGPEPKIREEGIFSLMDINRLEKFLKKQIMGQDDAIKSVLNSIKLVLSGLSQHSSLMFLGPTGVGKTQLAKLLGQSYSGNFYKVNCAEYSGGHEYAKLIGSPPGYVGHSEKSVLGEKAEISNKWVFLFDEVEKAHPKFFDFLLSLLDDGTCTDNLGNTLDFTESIFVFTSNQGMDSIKYGKQLGFERKTNDMEVFQQSKEKIRESVKGKFSPEFLNRLDDVITFNALTVEDVEKIVKLQLNDLPIRRTKPLVKFIIENGYSVEYGARNIARFIKNNVSVRIAEAILERKVPQNQKHLYDFKLKDNKLELVKLENLNEKSLDASG
tara:strand:- start:3979 stop:5331 length:1353 start_codon:yes stop_codon:yes gene_type:complete